MKTFKTTVKVLLIVAVIAILVVGMYLLRSKGLNFPDNGIYTPNNIIEMARPYIEKAILSMVLILIYLMIRYNKLGVLKVGAISFVAILVVQALVISAMTISRLLVNRVFFSILLLAFVGTVLILTSRYEKKLNTL